MAGNDFVTPSWWDAAFGIAKQLKLTEHVGHGLMLQFELANAPPNRSLFGVTVSADGSDYHYEPGPPAPPVGAAPGTVIRPLILSTRYSILQAIFKGDISGHEAYSRDQLTVVGSLEAAGQLLGLVETGRFANWRQQVKEITNDLD